MRSAEDLKLGSLITEPQTRDAVHIAVAPVVANEELSPGQRVMFSVPGDGRHVVAHAGAGLPVGVIDPFLSRNVRLGEECWLVLFPGTARNLRHDWDHPAFNNALAQSMADRVSKMMAAPDPDVPPGKPWMASANVRNIYERIRQLQTIREYRDQMMDSLPVLADALQEAGFKRSDFLAWLRNRGYSAMSGACELCFALVETCGDQSLEGSVRYLKQFADKIGKAVSDMMDAAWKYVESGVPESDDSWDFQNADYEEWVEFWRHYEAVIGIGNPHQGENEFYQCPC